MKGAQLGNFWKRIHAFTDARVALAQALEENESSTGQVHDAGELQRLDERVQKERTRLDNFLRSLEVTRE